MSLDRKTSDEEQYPPPREDAVGLTVQRDWTVEEEAKAKRK
jgi:hypothetical protein